MGKYLKRALAVEATIKFNLSNPEDKDSHDIFIKAIDFYCAILEIDQTMRHFYKHQQHDVQAFNQVRERFYQILEDRGISDFLV